METQMVAVLAAINHGAPMMTITMEEEVRP